MDLAAVYFMDRAGIREQSGGEQNEDAEHLPFRFQKRHCAVSNMAGKHLHVLVAGVLFADPRRFDRHYDQSQDPECGRQINYVIVHVD